jgi:Ca2+-transporting ATPase
MKFSVCVIEKLSLNWTIDVQTATKIARECGILTPGGLVLEGPHFRTMSAQEIDEALPRLQVLARSSPIDKYNLVKRYFHSLKSFTQNTANS